MYSLLRADCHGNDCECRFSLGIGELCCGIRCYCETLHKALYSQRIEPNAFQETIVNDDIGFMFENNPLRLLGRSKNTLRIEETDSGILLKADISNLRFKDELVAAVHDVETVKCYIEYKADPSDTYWTIDDDSKPVRHIQKASIRVVHICSDYCDLDEPEYLQNQIYEEFLKSIHPKWNKRALEYCEILARADAPNAPHFFGDSIGREWEKQRDDILHILDRVFQKECGYSTGMESRFRKIIPSEVKEMVFEGFKEWMLAQKEDILKILDRVFLKPKERSINEKQIKELIEEVNNYYGKTDKHIVRKLEKKKLDEGLYQSFLFVFRDSIRKLPEKERPDTLWQEGFMTRYIREKDERLCSFNRNELNRMIESVGKKGVADDELYLLLKDKLDLLYKDTKIVQREGFELSLLTSQVERAVYRYAGYCSIWNSEIGECAACESLDGKVVYRIVPPLHPGCDCSIKLGYKVIISPSDDSGIWNKANFGSHLLASEHTKHLSEYGDISFDAYVRGARKILFHEVSEGFPEHTKRDGKYCRYDVKNNDLVIAFGKEIVTRFKPDSKFQYWEESILNG